MDIPIEEVGTNGFTMRFIRFGSGEKTFVMLPGLSVKSVLEFADDIADAYASFKDNFTVYVFDRISSLPSEYSIEDMARDTAGAMIALGLSDVYLFGVSQGGMIAMVIAIEHPELVRKMVLGSTSAHVQKPQAELIGKWIEAAEKRDGVGLYLAFGEEIYPRDVFEASRESLISAGKAVTETEFRRFSILAEPIKTFDITDRLGDIRCPVLTIGAYDDRLLDPDATMEIAEKLDAMPGFRLFMYPGYGHAAYDIAPDYKNKVLDFMLR